MAGELRIGITAELSFSILTAEAHSPLSMRSKGLCLPAKVPGLSFPFIFLSVCARTFRTHVSDDLRRQTPTAASFHPFDELGIPY